MSLAWSSLRLSTKLAFVDRNVQEKKLKQVFSDYFSQNKAYENVLSIALAL
jgi:hypothetical protein